MMTCVLQDNLDDSARADDEVDYVSTTTTVCTLYTSNQNFYTGFDNVYILTVNTLSKYFIVMMITCVLQGNLDHSARSDDEVDYVSATTAVCTLCTCNLQTISKTIVLSDDYSDKVPI